MWASYCRHSAHKQERGLQIKAHMKQPILTLILPYSEQAQSGQGHELCHLWLAHSRNPSTQKANMGELQVQDQPGLHKWDPVSKIKIKTTKKKPHTRSDLQELAWCSGPAFVRVGISDKSLNVKSQFLLLGNEGGKVLNSQGCPLLDLIVCLQMLFNIITFVLLEPRNLIISENAWCEW